MTKKIIFIILLMMVAISAFSLPYANPFLRTWCFTIDGVDYTFKCDDQNRVLNVENGELYWYDYNLSGSLRFILATDEEIENKAVDRDKIYEFQIEFTYFENEIIGVGNDYAGQTDIKISGHVAPQ